MNVLIALAAIVAVAAATAFVLARGGRAARRGVAVVAVLLGVSLAAWYVWRPRTVPAVASAPPAASAASAPHPLSAKQLDHTVEQMQERVKANPKDPTAWAMLAHSLDMLGQHDKAGAAYAKLVELVPGDSQVLADYADSMALARGRRLDGEPLALLERALAIDPKNLKALALAGTEAFDRKDAERAIGFWQRALAQVTDPALRTELEGRIAEARTWKSAAPANPAAAAAATIAGTVTVADALKAKLSPDDTLFVFARPASGSKMPVALLRRKASELPLAFRLDDTMAMVPQARLSGQASVIVGARVSKRGDASPQPGDLQGFSAATKPGAKGLRIEIGEVVK